MKKREYKSKGDKYFIGFQPPNVWKKIKEDKELSKYYQQYRNHHKLIFEGKDDLEKLKRKVVKLKEEIKTQEKQLKVWNGKMLEGYSVIGDLSKDYDFNCSINLRKIKPRRLKMIEKGKEHEMRKHYNSWDIYGDTTKRGTKRLNTSSESSVLNMTGGVKGYKQLVEDSKKIGENPLYEPKRNLTIREKYYVRIEPKLKERFEKKKWIRNFYIGEKEVVLTLLKKSNCEVDWNTKSEKIIRDNLREIYKGYVRYQIFENGIQNIKIGDKSNTLSQHPSEKVIEWISEIGENIIDWMDK